MYYVTITKLARATISILAALNLHMFLHRRNVCWRISGVMLMLGEKIMNEITIGVANREMVSNRFIEAFETGKPQGNTISFESERQLWMTLTLERWEILKVLAGAGFVSANEVARRLNRDENAVMNDLKILLNTGFLEKTEDGKFAFPYDTVHVDFVLKAA